MLSLRRVAVLDCSCWQCKAERSNVVPLLQWTPPLTFGTRIGAQTQYLAVAALSHPAAPNIVIPLRPRRFNKETPNALSKANTWAQMFPVSPVRGLGGGVGPATLPPHAQAHGQQPQRGQPTPRQHVVCLNWWSHRVVAPANWSFHTKLLCATASSLL